MNLMSKNNGNKRQKCLIKNCADERTVAIINLSYNIYIILITNNT